MPKYEIREKTEPKRKKMSIGFASKDGRFFPQCDLYNCTDEMAVILAKAIEIINGEEMRNE